MSGAAQPAWVPEAPEPAMQYDYAEVDVNADLRHAQTATPEALADTGEAILRSVIEASTPPADALPLSDEDRRTLAMALLTEVRRRHPDFAESFPLIVRHIVYNKVFSKVAFVRFCRECYAARARAGFKRKEEFLETQGEYMVYERKEMDVGFRRNAGHVRAYRTQIIETLLREDREFIESQKEAEAITKARLRAVADEKRKQLLEFARSGGARD